MTADELDSLRADLARVLRRARHVQRQVSGTRHEMRTVLVAEALARCVRDLGNLVDDARGEGGVYGQRRL